MPRKMFGLTDCDEGFSSTTRVLSPMPPFWISFLGEQQLVLLVLLVLRAFYLLVSILLWLLRNHRRQLFHSTKSG